MTDGDQSRALVLRVWQHDDTIVGVVIVADNDPPRPVHLVGDAAVLEWIRDFLGHNVHRYADGDTAVTNPSRPRHVEPMPAHTPP